MSTPDRIGLEASQDAWAHAQQAPEHVPEDTRTHQGETRAAHQGSPSVAVQNATHGAPAPAEDRGDPQ